jgi:hypothetical protein
MSTLDILARNRLASALYAGFARADDLAEMTFVDPAGRDFYLEAAHRCVARLRLAAGYDPRDPRLLDLVAELTRRSDAFEELWVRQDVRERSGEARDFHHPKVGRLTLVYQAFDVHGSPGQQFVVYQAEPGSASVVSGGTGRIAALSEQAVDAAVEPVHFREPASASRRRPAVTIPRNCS